jgi:hypothetical protein
LIELGYEPEWQPPRSPKECAISKLEFIIHIPLHLRRLVRRDEAGFIGLAVAAGFIAGLWVAVLLACADFLRYWLYGQRHLSRLVSLDAPALGAECTPGDPSKQFRTL